MDGEEFLKHSTTHPKYLESNSTSHSWAFGALAELFDNAQDAHATLVNIDIINNAEHGKMLIVQDNGTGMDYKTLHKMLSFGHCTKKEGDIGRYGNGFKSGSMRMGSDAIVFTKDGTTKSMGMLSRTFLAVTHATEVLVPMVSWSDHTGEMIFRAPSKESKFMQNSLKVIHEHSPYHGMNDIETQFDLIEDRGTRIVIWNLRIVENTHKYELDFDHDKYDIYLNADLLPTPDKNQRETLDTQKNDHLASLRKYLTILYMIPKMKLVLRGVTVKTVIYSKTLHMAKSTLYRPKGSEEIKITFGFNPDRIVFGMMLYNKNRLIEAFLPVGLHNDHSSRAKGVLGICEANFLQPTHNKQKFVATSDYNKLKAELARRLRIYWNALDLLGKIGEFWQTEKYPDEEWVQCEQCLKWRFLEKRKHALKNTNFTCSLLYKVKSKDEACKVQQDTDCVHSHVIFQSNDKEEKIPAGREKWVGARVSLYWDSYDKWYEGHVLEYDEKKNKYKVQYDDGDLMWESYDDGFKILKLGSLKKVVTKENNVDFKQGTRKEINKNEEKQDKKEQRTETTPHKRKLSEVASPENNDRPAKRLRATKRLSSATGIRRPLASELKQDESKVVQVLKKKLSFIVNTLAKRGLITTDFINLVEEDNVIELDEVKLCNSLFLVSNDNNSNNHNRNPNNTNNSNVHNHSYEEEYDVNNTRSEMFDAKGNAYSDRHEEEEFIEYEDDAALEEEEASQNEVGENINYNDDAPSVARPVPFIQFL